MKKLLLLLTALTLTFSGCSLFEKEKNLTINLLTGESYYFSEKNAFPTIAPNNFIAEMRNNEVKGMHLGRTQMLVEAGNTTYNCVIDVQARNNVYADMSVYLGQSKEMIYALYKQPLKRDGNFYYFGKFGGIDGLLEVENAFEFVNNIVVSCAIYFDARNTKLIANHLLDRYAEYSTEQNVTFFGDAYDREQSNIVIRYDFSNRGLVYVAYTTRKYADLSRSKSSTSLMDNFRTDF